MTGAITATDTLADVVAKITHAAARAVTDTAAAMDLEVLQAAIDAITKAQRIDIYGVGAGALVGQHLHQKLHRIGLVSCLAHRDHHRRAPRRSAPEPPRCR